MKIFQIKGFSGLCAVVAAVIGVAAVAIALPTSFMLVLWNALIFEGLGGPEIGILQALLLWLATLIMLKLIFKPQFTLQFKKVVDPKEIEKHLRDFKNKEKE